MTWINRLKLWGGILGIAALVFALTVLFNQRQSQVASTSASVEAPTSIIGSSYGGVVTDVYVKQGDTVRAGQELFTLTSVQLQQDVGNGLKPSSTEAYDIDTKNGTITYKAVADGYVASIEAVNGSYLNSGSEMAVVVSDGQRTVSAQFELEPTDYGRVEIGAPARIVLPNNQLLVGTVAGVDVKTDDQGTAITYVSVESSSLTDASLSTLTRLDTPVTVIMDLRDDGWLAGPSEAMLAFFTKIGLR
ncbi:efflux RND transporter periplasmic adaptor subunit [Micropruina sonneratiae]|uniref:efflux RND transporter periplasmic adaptor subunit n=1 Tax=Micropruina sonneratiae TaxID=2986940 RepID=UPI0022272F26|nr:efflux RND transporter periplasmic adaptor subunit [Micropruina sp. KQZ13P-5]MCW3157417.1 efflux RND transporter periplasmic adaptor subunit [Micropruina sp. KQZ13P-5]